MQQEFNENQPVSRRKPLGGKPKRDKKKTQNKPSNVGSNPGPKVVVGLRVIGGRFRGSKLQYIGDNRVRPMKDRTREALFNLISIASKGSHVIDLFAGTGALAIEALSRGAVSATLIEVHLATLRYLKLNIESLKLTELCTVVQADAFYMGRHQADLKLPNNVPWLVFYSPPYDFFVSKQNEMLEMIGLLYENAPAGSTFVIEADERFDFDLLSLQEENRLRRRTYSPAEIGVFIKPTLIFKEIQ